jgi:hypothetical protein
MAKTVTYEFTVKITVDNAEGYHANHVKKWLRWMATYGLASMDNYVPHVKGYLKNTEITWNGKDQYGKGLDVGNWGTGYFCNDVPGLIPSKSSEV